MSSSENLDDFRRIPLEKIKWATEKFIHTKPCGFCDFAAIYSFEYSDGTWRSFKRYMCRSYFGEDFEPRQVRETFLNEVKIVSKLKHENIVGFHGYCDEADQMIIVYEWRGYDDNLAVHLKDDPNKRSLLTWASRLKICVDVAKGLSYLHSGLGEHGTVIHNQVMASKIVIDENMNAKIHGFGKSVLVPGNQPCQQVYKPDSDKDPDRVTYKDPIYSETGILKVESDVYSFGVLLFRILCLTRVFVKECRYDEYIPYNLTMKVQHEYHNRLDSLIDPAIRDQLGSPSFRMIEEITCKCLSYNVKDRPTMDTILKTIEDALDIHNREAIFVKGSRGEYQNPREFLIPFKEIELVRGMFKDSSLGYSIKSGLYTAQLSERWPNRTVVLKIYNIIPERSESNKIIRKGLKDYDTEVRRKMFDNELNIVSRFHHENIIPYIGYCDEGDNMILIYEHAINGSLRDHLQDQDKLRCISWEQRLKICLGAARGLKCLHSGLWDENRSVVHRHISSEYILLDEKMEAKISESGLSIFVPRYNSRELAPSDVIDYSKFSIDPIYKLSCILNTEVDVYSFGLVMFEVLRGLSQRTHINRGNPDLLRRVHCYYVDKELDKLVDPNIRDQIDDRSLQKFAETAYRCLSYNIKERPSMNKIIKKIEEALYFQKQKATDSTITTRNLNYVKLEDLLIPLKEIKSATSEFSENSKIGNGGFGVVYKGRLSGSWTKHEAAFKRLEKTSDKDKTGFRKELKLISMFHHQNIIGLIGYCDDGDEMILVSEYCINGSLDDHLEDPKKRRLLTWVKRLKICLGAAKGLDYLHTGLGEENRVIHRDVKSGNILLDENMEAKICDFGLSKSDSTYRQQQQSKLYTKVAGTNYYVDPIYHESGILRTESDVYSFGVVMFEMLSGMPAYYERKIGDDKPQPLINLVRRYYDYGKDLLIDPEIKSQIDKNSFHTFIEIAYQCISFNSKERPTMEKVADKIEEALDFQVKKDVSSKGD